MLSSAGAKAVVVDVGGVLYHTTQSTLCSRGGMLARQFSTESSFAFTSSASCDNIPFIDRDGDLFKYVLQYIRNGKLDLPRDFSSCSFRALRREADFYGLDGMLEALDAAEGLLPALREGAPVLRCARTVFTSDGVGPSWSRPMMKSELIRTVDANECVFVVLIAHRGIPRHANMPTFCLRHTGCTRSKPSKWRCGCICYMQGQVLLRSNVSTQCGLRS
jgi:hypothetical protein